MSSAARVRVAIGPLRHAGLASPGGSIERTPLGAALVALGATLHAHARHRTIFAAPPWRRPQALVVSGAARGLAASIAARAVGARPFVLLGEGEAWSTRLDPIAVTLGGGASGAAPTPVGAPTLTALVALAAHGLDAHVVPEPPRAPRLSASEIEGLRRALDLGPSRLLVLELDAPLDRDGMLRVRQALAPGVQLVVVAPEALHGAFVPLAMASRVSNLVRLLTPDEPVADVIAEAADVALFPDPFTREARRATLQAAGVTPAVLAWPADPRASVQGALTRALDALGVVSLDGLRVHLGARVDASGAARRAAAHAIGAEAAAARVWVALRG